jgi:hypothetical protein
MLGMAAGDGYFYWNNVNVNSPSIVQVCLAAKNI